MENNDPASISLPRTSELQAPIMLLTGHDAPIYAMKFSPCGRYVASGSHDKKICEYRSLALPTRASQRCALTTFPFQSLLSHRL